MMDPEFRLAIAVVCRDHPSRVLFRACLDTDPSNWLQPYAEGGMTHNPWTTGFNTSEFRFYEHFRGCPRHHPRRSNEFGVDRINHLLRSVSTTVPAPRTWRVTDLDLSRILGLSTDWDAEAFTRALELCDTRVGLVRQSGDLHL